MEVCVDADMITNEELQCCQRVCVEAKANCFTSFSLQGHSTRYAATCKSMPCEQKK